MQKVKNFLHIAYEFMLTFIVLIMHWYDRFYKWSLKQDAILLILVVIVMNRFTSWITPYKTIYPFPFHDIRNYKGEIIGITVQSYYYIFCQHLLMLAFWQYCRIKSRIDIKTSTLFYNYLAIEIVSLIDFMLIYEHPWFHIHSFGVEFTDVKILLYLIFFARWTRFKQSL